jgi:hypothetical protein
MQNNTNTEDLDLDISWLEDVKKLTNITDIYKNEHQDNIQIYFIYINIHSTIEHVFKETYNLKTNIDNKQIITRECLLQIIQQKKICQNKRYKLFDILKFVFNLESDRLQFFSSDVSFIKKVNIIDEVIIEPSIFLFHKLNSLFFIYKETPPFNKSSLKILENKTPIKKTKKASFDIENTFRNHKFTKRTNI